MKEISRDEDANTVVLMGGSTYFCNGINLNTIEAAHNPAEESWLNINAIDDVILEFLKLKSKCIIANLARNAGAGGVMMALAVDIVLSNREIIFNPAYSGMGLYHIIYMVLSIGLISCQKGPSGTGHHFTYPRLQSPNVCPPNVSSDQNKRRTNNPFEKAAKLEEICDLMQNPSPIGWQRAVDLNIIDCCDWNNAQAQENDLPRFIHANFELIS